MAKKRFGIDQATSEAISQTMQMAKDHDSNFINAEVLISKIELDPDNPRKHKILFGELKTGPNKGDPEYPIKHGEYEGLCELSASIVKDGLLHPIVVFKNGDNYKLVAGERRFFASIIADKTQIEARVFKNKPKLFDLKIIQWMENDSRKDLSLHKKLMNVSSIVDAYQSENGERLTAVSLSRILCLSRQQAQFYIAILSNNDLMELIKEFKVTTMEVARRLASTKTRSEILKYLGDDPKKKGVSDKKYAVDKSKTPGRKRSKVALGTTSKPSVVKTIIDSVLALEQFGQYSEDFRNTDWDCLNQSTKAFQRLIKLLEKENGVTV